MVHLVTEATLLVVLLGAADEVDWDLLVGAYDSAERLSSQDTVCKLLANLSR